MIGAFPTIPAALDAAAAGVGELRFHDTHGTVEQVLSYRALREMALAVACRLSAAGLGHGDRLAVAAETRPEFLALFYGCQYAGIIPCPLPVRSNLGNPAVYGEKIAAMLRAGNIRTMVELPRQSGLDMATENAGAALIPFDSLIQLPAGPLPIPSDPDDIAYIQFSSGSTAHPKGIVITHRAVSANVTAILTHGLRLTATDRAFSWLPFYHDMGLVGFSIAPIYGQCSVDYLTALAFARRPVLWLRLMATYGSTITYAPSFGYRLAAQRYRSEPETIDLSRLRVAGIGGDMIRADILGFFTEALRETGFRKEAFLPSYGMAEATLAVSFGETGKGIEIDHVDREAAEEAGDIRIVAESNPQTGRSFVSCGYPLPGIDVRIEDDMESPLPDMRIGRIRVRGANLTRGYADDPERTTDILRPDGFMDTGDLGYMRRGQLVVTGRVKDLILFRGRNIWPEDIEWAAERAASLNHGESIAFSIDNPSGDDTVILLVQAGRRGEDDLSTLEDRIHQAVSQALGISCIIVFVAPGSLPKTSSGKLARTSAKNRYREGQYG